MSNQFYWDENISSHELYHCVSEALTWDELKPALAASWVRFFELSMASRTEKDFGSIRLSFFGSSGRVTLERVIPEIEESEIPEDFPTIGPPMIMCHCSWIEQQWLDLEEKETTVLDRMLGELGTNFAKTTLQVVSMDIVLKAISDHQVPDGIVVGQGVTQSPAAFETTLDQLQMGILPKIVP
ncbi:hypothetical protein [Tuwongella immobilis]|uniref:Uncharacterized protein n=1 Tax=Tuwongella immobilis TaxID=692036 RepID=A0A6C2YJ39_9BACT|nr:hypothetical protein [Tuwongella immobilis]VIP01301.1 unnamed protein product [Tuwongella immobilis]VTR98028.1 unnamed protein product [Tuwongella immobilis]